MRKLFNAGCPVAGSMPAERGAEDVLRLDLVIGVVRVILAGQQHAAEAVAERVVVVWPAVLNGSRLACAHQVMEGSGLIPLA